MIPVITIIVAVTLIASAWRANADRVRNQPREPRRLEPRLP